MTATPDAISASASTGPFWLHVALDVPLDGVFDYQHHEPVLIGQRVIVHFGRRQMIGVVVALPEQPSYPPEQVKAIDRSIRHALLAVAHKFNAYTVQL